MNRANRRFDMLFLIVYDMWNVDIIEWQHRIIFERLKKDLLNSGLEIVNSTNISKEVLRALDDFNEEIRYISRVDCNSSQHINNVLILHTKLVFKVVPKQFCSILSQVFHST